MSIFLDRRSIRNYDENYKIPRNELNEILNKALRAPSAMNLQPTRFVVIESKEAKEKVRPAMTGNYLQLDTSSAFILLLTDLDKYAHGVSLFKRANELGFLPNEVAERQINTAKERITSRPKERVLLEGYLDAGLVAMQLMLVAKEHGYDTCPIAGFNKDTILEHLGMPSESLKPVLIISIGKAKESGYKTYRLGVEEVTTYL